MLSFTGVGAQAQSLVPRVAFDAVSIKPADVPNWLPPVFSAVREQLGLKLEPRDESLDVLVIDRIERPSPN
jgi:hypothetical protein